MPVLTPIIEGIDAIQYLQGVPKLDPDRILIVIGTAPGYMRELRNAMAMFRHKDLMTINKAGRKMPYPVKYACTMHSADFGTDEKPNEDTIPAACIPPGAICHGLKVYGAESKYIKHTWRILPCCGTSALFGVIVGLCLGYQRIMTVGVHLKTGMYGRDIIKECWSKVWYPVIKDKVRGWSGLPREILGRGW